jgi:phosphohistidine phosphatase
VRHAKSSRDDPALDDHDRPLAPRGQRALPRLVEHLRQLGPPPSLVLCSSARRTVETLEGLRAALADDTEISIEERLYGASAHGLLDRLHAVEERHAAVLVIGHNPGVEDLVAVLVAPPSGMAPVEKFPTAATAVLAFDRLWPDLGPGDALIESFWTPR